MKMLISLKIFIAAVFFSNFSFANPAAQLLNAQPKVAQVSDQDETTILESLAQERTVPFGSNLFAGGFESERIDGQFEDYLIAAGDKLNIWIWGAANFSEVVTVDNQGNIFLPNIGPISVINQKASGINQFVTEKIKTVYRQGVQVYVNLLSATPVSVYITGSVERPGQYAGFANDSVLYFLKRAGGIDNERGSYRNIIHKRQGSILAEHDLYGFLNEGQLSKVHFKDGDTLVVKSVGPQIKVLGGVKFPFTFELDNTSISGSELLALAKIDSNVSHVGISGTRNTGPFSKYIPLKDFSELRLSDGDTVLFNDDLRADVLDIKLAGSYKGPSYYSVKKKTRLKQMLAAIEIDPELANHQAIYINRVSVARKQKQSLEQALQRLERSVFTAPASSDGEARIRAQEAQLVMEFVERARQIVPSGKVIVSDGSRVADILLENEDEIVIPEKSDLVMISGEVLLPQAVVFKDGAKIGEYVSWAGGFTERANRGEISVLKPNGLLLIGSEQVIEPGDQIIVLPEIDSKNMQLVKDITQIIYQMAIAGSVLDRLND